MWGVAIVGHPVARHLDDGWTLEVSRCCTDGTRNACSMLYAAAWRAARAMGYHKLITYILDTEPGTSLKAAGWRCVGQAGGLRWTGKRRPQVDLCPAQMKMRFEIGEAEHAELLEALLAHRGPVLLSGYDNPLYNDTLEGWDKLRHLTVAEGGQKRVETLWCNFGVQTRLEL